MSFEKINIDKPCHELLANMSRCSGGYFCGVCEKKVIDLRKKSASEIAAIAKSDEQLCVIVHQRHTTDGSGYAWINRIENFLLQRKLKMVSFMLVGCFLFLSSCNNRKPKHKMGGKGSDTLFKTSEKQ